MPSRRISTRTPIIPTTTRRDQARAIRVRHTDSATAADSVVAVASTAAVEVLREVGKFNTSGCAWSNLRTPFSFSKFKEQILRKQILSAIIYLYLFSQLSARIF